MDTLFLSRLQFCLTVSFHFIFVSMSIGLAWSLVILELLGWKGKNGEIYTQVAKSFSNLFAATFIMGIATGIVMEFQIGMNWAGFSRFAGDIFGTLLAAEGFLAFFVESSFLGLYLFGRNRVPMGLHWFSILMVAAASTFSAFWIIAANSWLQTPAGFLIRNERIEMSSFWDVVFNPSTIHRFFHTINATLIVAAFFLAGVASYLLLQNRMVNGAKRLLRLAIFSGLILSVLQLFPSGHEHAKQVAATQPEKFAALEAVYETRSHAPMVLFGIPAIDKQELRWAIKIPGFLSWVTFGDSSAVIKGIKDFPADEVPPHFIPFVAFRIMVALGIYFILLMLYGAFNLYRNSLWKKRMFLSLLVWSVPLPIAAAQLGWIAAEVGRQPWIVYRVMRTGDGVSRTLSSGDVATSVILFSLFYTFLGILYIYIILREIKKWT